jgi:hypothetical protein
MPVVSGSLGLFFGVSVPNPTGASRVFNLALDQYFLTTLHHFCPHLTLKWFVVNMKIEGHCVTKVLDGQSARSCG